MNFSGQILLEKTLSRTELIFNVVLLFIGIFITIGLVKFGTASFDQAGDPPFTLSEAIGYIYDPHLSMLKGILWLKTIVAFGLALPIGVSVAQGVWQLFHRLSQPI